MKNQVGMVVQKIYIYRNNSSISVTLSMKSCIGMHLYSTNTTTLVSILFVPPSLLNSSFLWNDFYTCCCYFFYIILMRGYNYLHIHITVPIQLHTLGEEANTHSIVLQDCLHRHRKQILLNEIKQVAIYCWMPCSILNHDSVYHRNLKSKSI